MESHGWQPIARQQNGDGVGVVHRCAGQAGAEATVADAAAGVVRGEYVPVPFLVRVYEGMSVFGS